MNEKHSVLETDQEILNAVNRMTDRSIESNMMMQLYGLSPRSKTGVAGTTQLMFLPWRRDMYPQLDSEKSWMICGMRR